MATLSTILPNILKLPNMMTWNFLPRVGKLPPISLAVGYQQQRGWIVRPMPPPPKRSPSKPQKDSHSPNDSSLPPKNSPTKPTHDSPPVQKPSHQRQPQHREPSAPHHEPTT